MQVFMLDMMTAMEPYMMPLAWSGIGLLVLAVLFSLVSATRGLGRMAALLALLVGLFFLAAQGAGMMLGAEPSLAFFADPRNFDFGYQVPYWQLGIVLAVLGLVIRALARGRAG